MAMLRRVATALGARVRVVFEAEHEPAGGHLAEAPLPYRVKRSRKPAENPWFPEALFLSLR
jgi:hypothetical protein